MRKLIPTLSLFIFFSCSKKDNQPSSEKSISIAVMSKADNPQLPADITGNISPNTISFEIPPNVSAASLVPNISFKGKSIEPANKTAQNFTFPVTYTVKAEDGSMQQYILSVFKTTTDTASLFVGNWNVLKDSVTNIGGFATSQGTPLPGVYYGTSVDFWKFDLNGTFSGRENNITGSSPYQFLASGKLDINIWTMYYGLATIDLIDSHSLVVHYSATSGNGGQYYRKVYLYH